MDSKELLAFLSIKHKGNFSKILNAIQEKEKVDEDEVKNTLKDLKCNYLTIIDERYPQSLKRIHCPPIVLFYYGDISLISNLKDCIASIGSRNASEYGINMTKEIIKGLSSNYVIVSGLAKGIDATSHTAAIESNKKTVGVLGCGIDYVYPKCNEELFIKLKKDHLIISEYPGDLEPSPEFFPFRNRIIAGLSRAVFVGESYIHSGTNITVYYALQQSKDVFALPFQAGEGSYNNKLINDGAILVESAKDIEENLSRV